MRFIHTSDWHIGRIFHERSLLADQEHVLKGLIALARDSKPDALVISGDIYDRAIPPADAVKLLDWALSELVRGVGVPILLISGNHDSADRLGFGAGLLSARLRIVSNLDSMLKPLVLSDRHGEVAFYGVPYFEPAELRAGSGESVPDHEAAMRYCLAKLRASLDPTRSTVVSAHAFVMGGAESQSERPLNIGGAYSVPTAAFEGFAYTALGHLHRPQNPAPGVRYSGSLLPYHFDEHDQPKSVTLVELGKDRVPKLEIVPLSPLRSLRIIEGRFRDILAAAPADSRADDYILVRRENDGLELDPIGRLRKFYPNILGIETLPSKSAAITSGPARSEIRRGVNLHELFSAFFSEVTGNPLDELQARRVLAALKDEA